ncbi:MAG: VWA domain-containing protein [Gammaproteobacteria bacterium]|nr:VWA domain-containing protein [Gammaproteobacteria bacterium]MDH4313860.1 VWA domain-containing protein [Gammaproteobacteria bacterium]MDH5215201.1 VWA domain-containing protein [Gammaproteobacteria bacterium]MDH5499531.1 VWA domain-containing protein [Gammaproteobacteria bacterium]
MKKLQTPNPDNGRLAENMLLFCRTLRRAGLPIGPGAVIDALVATSRTGIRRRDDFFFALRAVLAKNPAEFLLFDQAFHIYFRDLQLLQRLARTFSQEFPRDGSVRSADTYARRLTEWLQAILPEDAGDAEIDVDRSESYSATELLRSKDFELMSAAEQIDAKRMLRELPGTLRSIQTRRFRPSSRGHRFDLRRSMQLMMQSGGQPVQLARRRPRQRPQALVMLCDISGSMSCYSRMFLHFAHAMTTPERIVHAFVFGTRLTNISRWLRNRDVDEAMSRISMKVPDWDGGTRIADSLEAFNVQWGRRVSTDNATVVLLCDGLERDSHAELSFQMQRLRRCCRELIWMNPMLRYKDFEAKASGIRAMLPHVDRFVAAHNVASLSELARLLDARTESRASRRAA